MRRTPVVEGVPQREGRLAPGFDEAVYHVAEDDTVVAILSSGEPREGPKQAMLVRMFWRPQPGQTPIDATATNATLHHIQFAENGTHTAVYHGSGFVYFRGDPGEGSLELSVWDAILVPKEAGEAFEGPARQLIKGSFTAAQNETLVQERLQRLRQRLQKQLGSPHLVQGRARRWRMGKNLIPTRGLARAGLFCIFGS
jgi:hypothetical protein